MRPFYTLGLPYYTCSYSLERSAHSTSEHSWDTTSFFQTKALHSNKQSYLFNVSKKQDKEIKADLHGHPVSTMDSLADVVWRLTGPRRRQSSLSKRRSPDSPGGPPIVS